MIQINLIENKFYSESYEAELNMERIQDEERWRMQSEEADLAEEKRQAEFEATFVGPPVPDPKFWMTVQMLGSGYAAVMMWKNEEDLKYPFDEPYETGIGRYKNYKSAWYEARSWAESEEIPLTAAFHDV